MDPHRPSLDHGDLALPGLRYRAWVTLGVLGTRVGRLLGMGPGRGRLADALDHRHRIPALSDDAGKTRHAEGVECVADLHHLHALDIGYAAHAQRHHLVGARVCTIAYRKLVWNLSRLSLRCVPVLLYQEPRTP